MTIEPRQRAAKRSFTWLDAILLLLVLLLILQHAVLGG
jgi:hypothetical protein